MQHGPKLVGIRTVFVQMFLAHGLCALCCPDFSALQTLMAGLDGIEHRGHCVDQLRCFFAVVRRKIADVDIKRDGRLLWPGMNRQMRLGQQ